ncbi:MAG: transporter substrate-binding domain-containing protein [Pseudomonadota bacterium]
MLGGLALPAHAAGGDWQRIRERGSLVVGLYQDMPPFHVKGQGIDVALGRALAEALGLGFSALPFTADEDMADDLRNMVWKGHFLGWGPADVLLHVPLDPPLQRANPQVQIVAPYYRERVLLAFDTTRLPRVEALAELRGHRLGAAGQSLAGWLMIGAEGGLLREHLATRWPDGVAVAQALKAGQLDAAAGLASELESVLGGDTRFVLQPLPSPRAPRDGWAVGCAVKKDATELAQALQQAMQWLQASGRLGEVFATHGVSWRL